MTRPDQPVTALLKEWRAGNREALDLLTPMVYDQLRAVAAHQLRARQPGHTLRATALVHEAYLRLVDIDIPFSDRAHFFAVASQLMRRILVDWARAHGRQKRGGGAVAVPLDEVTIGDAEDTEAVLGIHLALEKLAAFDARRAGLLEMVLFGGMTYEEAAEVVGTSAATVHRDLKLARAWLAQELGRSGPV
jgi:RNA polymerase sigma factor (TIGR02999 family)